MSDEPEQVELDLASLLGLNQPRDYAEISIENYRTLLMYEEIDEMSSKDVCEFLLKCYFDDPTLPVTIIINSPGGSCDDGFAIIDLMDALPMTIRTIALGQIMSMGFMMFMAGSKGERYMAPNATFMSHQFSNHLGGKDFEVEASLKVQKMTRENMYNHIHKHTGLTKKKILEVLLPQHDVFLSAAECLELGVGDRYMDKETFLSVVAPKPAQPLKKPKKAKG